MARIAFAWELGGEFGHAMACSALARMLQARGHEIAFLFRELHQLSFLADTSDYAVFQAPVSVREGHRVAIPASFAEILVGCGYDSGRHLAGLLGGWLSLFDRWNPDIVLSDFSPTALLAARLRGLRRVSYGNGFAVPPRLSPLPAFRFDEPIDPARVVQSDARALGSANDALARFGGAPMRHLAQQFETDDDFLATFPELDSYGNRPAAGYWGPRFSVDAGVSVHWPAGNGKRVLVYLKRQLPALDALIAALARSPHRVAAFIPELEPARAARLAGPGRIVSEQPMRRAPPPPRRLTRSATRSTPRPSSNAASWCASRRSSRSPRDGTHCPRREPRLYSRPPKEAEKNNEHRGTREEPDHSAEAGVAEDRRGAPYGAGPLHPLRDDPRGDSRGVRIHRALAHRDRDFRRDLSGADRLGHRAPGGAVPDVARHGLPPRTHHRRARAELREREGFQPGLQGRGLHADPGVDRGRVQHHPVARHHRRAAVALQPLPALPGIADPHEDAAGQGDSVHGCG